MKEEKKRTWSEEKINGKLGLAILIMIFLTLFLLILLHHAIIGMVDESSWQPYNCVNETKIISSLDCFKICVSEDCFVVNYVNCSYKNFEVSTSRQICSQELFVRNAMRVIG